MKIIKKFEVEIFETLGLVVVDVYPTPSCDVTIYRQTIKARTFQHMPDKARATFISEAAAQGIQHLMEVKSEDD